MVFPIIVFERTNMYKSITYHARKYNDPNVKLFGGTFGGSVDLETIDRLVNAHFDVVIKPSGAAVFVDKAGREISLSITIAPEYTSKGREALREYNKSLKKLEKENDLLSEEVEYLLAGMTTAEILQKLRGK